MKLRWFTEAGVEAVRKALHDVEKAGDLAPATALLSREDPTIGKLSQKCWKANRDDFERLSKLPREPGYKDERAFRATLYALARNYPAVDHFRWID